MQDNATYLWTYTYTRKPFKMIGKIIQESCYLYFMKREREVKSRRIPRGVKVIRSYFFFKNKFSGELPGSPMVRTLCFQCKGTSSIPGQGN